MKRSWGIFEHRNGKTFLKRDDWKEFREVEVRRFGKKLRVCPVFNQRKLLKSTA